MKKRDYAWWQARIKRALAHFDGVRLDHFRAFVAHWEIPADASSARDGCWVAGPGQSLFDALKKALGPLPLCVEDLGAIDDDVIALRDGLGLPGMRILHYAFDGNGKNPHLPHNHPKAALVYPGNHDNDTTLGWWHKLSMQRRSLAQHYLQRHGDDIVWDLNRAALASVANVAVIAVQDVLALDGDARFNDPDSYRRLPPKERPNWRWRLTSEQLQPIHADRLRFFASLYGRLSE
jgi:4-alpha-glucanotransferase